jgi:hypothetical protein
MFGRACLCMPIVSILYFALFNSFYYSPLPLYLPPPLFWQLSMHILTSSTFTELLFYIITDALSFSFPFLLSPSSIEYFHYYKYVLYMSLYMIMLVLCICLSFGSFFHIWEKTCVLCFSEPVLLHLAWYPPLTSIYLQSTWCHYSF